MGTIALTKLFMKDMPRVVRYVLYITLATWALWGFKQIEPKIFPVVKDFKVTNSEAVYGGKQISGEMTKVRSCDFKELVAYSNKALVSVVFQDREIKDQKVVSRIEGTQKWGWWLITPAVNHIEIYSKHDCTTGTVWTKLYEGEI